MSTDAATEARPTLTSWDCAACRRHGCRRGGGGWRGRRMFDAGELRLLILVLLDESPRHGYEIIKELGTRVGGGYQPSPGVVYPSLALLEELGLAAAGADEGGRRLYALTAAGRQALDRGRPALAALRARLDATAAARGGPPAEVMAAMEELVLVVRERLRKGPATGESIAEVAGALRAAAAAVRRG